MSCSVFALIHAAEYPETVRVYIEGRGPNSPQEADRAAVGLLWRHRSDYAEKAAVAAYAETYGSAPTGGELSETRNRWLRTLEGYTEALREAVGTNCESLFEAADRFFPGSGYGRGASVTRDLQDHARR